MSNGAVLAYGDVKRWKGTQGGNWDQEQLDRLIRNFTPSFKPPLLDVGCGNGRWRKYFPENTVSMDISDKASKPLIQAVVQHLPFQAETFQTVVAVTVLQHVPLPEREWVHAEIDRVLQPDGHFILIDGNAETSNSSYLWTLPWQKLAELVQSRFTVQGVFGADKEYVGLLLRKKTLT